MVKSTLSAYFDLCFSDVASDLYGMGKQGSCSLLKGLANLNTNKFSMNMEKQTM